MYYRIISNLGTEEVDVERVNSLIQISENQLEGFRPVIDEGTLPEKEGFYVASDYKIINGEVHKTYRYEEIVEVEEGEMNDVNLI